MTMKIGYLEVVEVKKIRSRNVCQLIVEADISQFKELVQLDEKTGVFIPCFIEGAVCGALDLDIEIEEIEALMGMTTKKKEVIEHDPGPETGKKERSLASRMVVQGYFLNRDLWAAMDNVGAYTQKEHYEAVKQMKPCDFYPFIKKEGDTIAHHVRTAANSGTGIKPQDWYCIPLSNSQHQHLHNHATREDRADHLEAAIKITADCMREAFKRHFALTTMTGYTAEQLASAEKTLGINTTFSRERNVHQ